MTRVIIFGSNGMLGRYLTKYLGSKYDVVPLTRKEYDVLNDNINLSDILIKYIDTTKDNVVINAIGLIPQASKNYKIDDKMYIKINSVFPHLLACICEKYNVKMIHSTTDCVFDGQKGNYVETDYHDANSIYGITKSTGEPSNCTVIRTSIIGEEIDNQRSLLEWVKSNINNEINGYNNHYWNGITCLQYAKIIDTMISNNILWKGVRHIFSPKSVSKYDLVNMINNIYDLNIKINKYNDTIMCDRTLNTIYDKLFDIPQLNTQIEELSKFSLI